MVFSSMTFLLVFLPITVALYYLPSFFNGKDNIAYRNIILCAASLIFYAWGEPLNIVLMLISICFNYFIGLDMDRHRNDRKHRKGLLIASVIFNVGMLGFFKYSGFVAENISSLFGITSRFNSPSLPIGISFYTFQILSYVIDVYKYKVGVQKSLLDFALYISMFPQLIAGPIVQYSVVDTQLRYRRCSLPLASEGVYLFSLGLAKKVVLANAAGSIFNDYIFIGYSKLSVTGAWCAVIFFAFQIYFDFSGYSDMAKGLGYIFGFEFPENFNYPYIADSITDFWRRWHITLSTWFRDYIYIPLGGSRRSTGRNIFNLFVVWALTGLWHGASWNFVLWGIYYFVLLVLEKYVFQNLIEKMPKFLRHLLTLVLILFGWVIFSSESLADAGSLISCMLGANSFCDDMSSYLFWSNLFMIIVMSVFSTPVFGLKQIKGRRADLIKFVITAVLLVVSFICLIADTYNPFLYFRF